MGLHYYYGKLKKRLERFHEAYSGDHVKRIKPPTKSRITVYICDKDLKLHLVPNLAFWFGSSLIVIRITYSTSCIHIALKDSLFIARLICF